MEKWDEYFINMCNVVKTKSKDKNTQLGVVIVGNDHQIISAGYNSFPRGINDGVPERQEKPEKYYWFSHAETNAIINSALNGVSTKNTKMYMNCGVPCADCARNIINSGIVEIICKSDHSMMSSPERHEDSAKRSMILFKEAKVKVRYWDEVLQGK